VLRGVRGVTSTDLVQEPWYEIVLLVRGKGGCTRRVVGATRNRGAGARATRLHLREAGCGSSKIAGTAPSVAVMETPIAPKAP